MINMLSYLWNHKVGVVFFLFLVALIGLFGTIQIDKTMYPNTKLPEYVINANWGNYSPEVMELRVTAPIERAVSKLKYVKGIESRSRKGSSTTRVLCDKDYAVYEFELLLNETMREIRDDLPENAFTRVIRTDPDEDNGRNNSFMTYRIFAPYSIDSLSRLVENEIKIALSSIPGISEVNEFGLEKQAFFVTIKQEYRDMPRFGVGRVSQAISTYFRGQSNASGSVLRYNDYEFSVKFDEKFLDYEALKKIPMANLGGRVVHLEDIALINKGPELKRQLIRFNGLDGITLDMKRRPDATAVKTAELVKAKMEALEAQYDLTTQLLTDEGADVQKKLDDLFLRVAVSIIVIFIITFMISRQLYNSVVVMLLLILSGLFSIFGLYITGNSINLLTIGGLALGFGMIIDNSLIVIERLSFIKKDTDYKEKVLTAMSHIITPVKVSTYTTIGAIIPVFVMDELLKITLSPFVIALSFSLVASLIISVLFLPLLVKESKESATEYEPHKNLFTRGILWMGAKRKLSLLILACLIGLPAIPFYAVDIPKQIEGVEWYNDFMNSKTFKVVLRPTAGYAFGGALFVYMEHLKDKFSWGSFRSLGDDDKESLNLFIRPPSGTKLEDINAIMTQFETIARQYIEKVDHIYVSVSAFAASMQIYFTDEQFQTTVPEEIKDKMTEQTVNFGGIDLSISGVGDAVFIRGAGFSMGPQGEGAVRYELTGPNYDELKLVAEQLKAKLETSRRVKNIDITSSGGWRNSSQTQMLLNYNTSMEPYEYDWVQQNMNSLLERDETELRIPGLNGDEYIYVKSEGKNLQTVRDFTYQVYLNDSLTPVKIANLGELQEEKVQGTILRRDQIYVRPIAFEYRASKSRVERYKKTFETYAAGILPEDIKMIEPEEDVFAFEQGLDTYVIIFITLLIVFSVIAMYFESFKYTAAVFTIIPFSLVGITFFFHMMDQAFDNDAIFGLMFVAGIVINNAAFVIYEIQRKRREGNDFQHSVEQTVIERTRPTFLTTVTTIVGILPLFLPQILLNFLSPETIAWLNSVLPTAISDFLLKNTNTDSMWYALSLSTISGVTASFIFSLWVPIVLFSSMDKKSKRKKLQASTA